MVASPVLPVKRRRNHDIAFYFMIGFSQISLREYLDLRIFTKFWPGTWGILLKLDYYTK